MTMKHIFDALAWLVIVAAIVALVVGLVIAFLNDILILRVTMGVCALVAVVALLVWAINRVASGD